MKIVLAGYTEDKTRSALAFCAKLVQTLPIDERVLVLNDPRLATCLRPADWTVLHGSNELGEFSAWQQGLDHVVRQGPPSTVVFVNDTVTSHRRFSAFRRWALVHELWHAEPRSIVGFVDHAENDLGDLRIGGLVLPGWVSSYCFALGAETLDGLEHRLFDWGQVGRCVSGGLDEASFLSPNVSADLQRQIQGWLFEGGWYRSRRLTAESEEMLTQKARSICAELLLSARCWAIGARRRDPFERHPGARRLDDLTERLIRRSGLSNAQWVHHPQNWQPRGDD